MEQTFQSKFMHVRVSDYSIHVYGSDSRMEIDNIYKCGRSHTLEGASVTITSDDITIEGTEYFRVYCRFANLEDAQKRYEFTDEDIEERIRYICTRPTGLFARFKKDIVTEYKVKYLKNGAYVDKIRKDYHLVSSLNWTIEFSRGDVLSSVELA